MNLPLALLEYRLAPAHPHPAQLEDVLAGLSLLTSSTLLEAEGGTAKWDRNVIYLVGHSAGAFMVATVALSPPADALSPHYADQVRPAIRGIVGVDGIYCLPSLLEEYPSYDSFVHETFGSDPAVLARESPTSWSLPPSSAPQQSLHLLIVHSTQDELLTQRQAEVIVKHAREVIGGRGTVEGNFGFKGKHHEVPRGEELAQAVAEWVKKLEAIS